MTSSNFEDTITGCQYGIGYPQHTYAEPINIQISEMENRLKKSIRNATYKYRPRGWGRGLCRKTRPDMLGFLLQNSTA